MEVAGVEFGGGPVVGLVGIGQLGPVGQGSREGLVSQLGGISHQLLLVTGESLGHLGGVHRLEGAHLGRADVAGQPGLLHEPKPGTRPIIRGT